MLWWDKSTATPRIINRFPFSPGIRSYRSLLFTSLRGYGMRTVEIVTAVSVALILSAVLAFGAPMGNDSQPEDSREAVVCSNTRCHGTNACVHFVNEACCINQGGSKCTTHNCSGFENCETLE